MLTQAIRSSSKLVSILDGVGHSFWSLSLVFSLIMRLLKVLSADGKKVKRKHPFTDKEKEDLQVKKLYAFLFFCFRMDSVKVSSHCRIVHVFLLFFCSLALLLRKIYLTIIPIRIFRKYLAQLGGEFLPSKSNPLFTYTNFTFFEFLTL